MAKKLNVSGMANAVKQTAPKVGKKLSYKPAISTKPKTTSIAKPSVNKAKKCNCG